MRLLTVLKPRRGRDLAALLMYAALRWVEAHAGTRIVAIGRREVAEMYVRVGLRRVGRSRQAHPQTPPGSDPPEDRVFDQSVDLAHDRIKL